MDRNIIITPILPPRSTVALHPEGVDRNELRVVGVYDILVVALHPEGVDRNGIYGMLRPKCPPVALHPEGVDRNQPGKL